MKMLQNPEKRSTILAQGGEGGLLPRKVSFELEGLCPMIEMHHYTLGLT